MPVSVPHSIPHLIVSAICAIGVAYGLTWLARWIAPRVGMVDHPDGRRKCHGRPMPVLGGVAVFSAFCFTAVACWFLAGDWLAFHPSSGSLGLTLLTSGALFCLIGLYDDKVSLRARDKLFLQVVAAVPFAMYGHTIERLTFFGLEATFGPFALPVTLLWIVACVNVVNLLDGLDGLAATIGLISSVTIAILSVIAGRPEVAMLSLIMAGSLVGFLIHNWPPAKIFLGDAGSLTIGFLVGALSIEASIKTAAGFTLAVPLAVLCVPIFDTTMAILRRKLNGRGIGDADREHIHHKLQQQGLTSLQTLLVIGGLCVAMAMVAVVTAYYKKDWIALAGCVAVLAPVILFRVFGHSEIVLVLRHAQTVPRLINDASALMATRRFILRIQSTDPSERFEYWDEAVSRVAAMGGIHVELTCYGPGDRPEEILSRKTWNHDQPERESGSQWNFACAVTRDQGRSVCLTATGQSVESPRVEQCGDLFRLFDSLCRYWPLEGDAQQANEESPATIRMFGPAVASEGQVKPHEPVPVRRAA